MWLMGNAGWAVVAVAFATGFYTLLLLLQSQQEKCPGELSTPAEQLQNEWSLVSCIPNGLMVLLSLYRNHWAVATRL
jgi:hypothetical protein